MITRTLAACAICALVVVSVASAKPRPPTVSLKLTVNGSGTIKISGKPSVKCAAATCHRTFRVRKGSKVTLLANPVTLGKLAPWKGACKGTAPKCTLRMKKNRQVAATFIAPGARTNPIPLNTAWDAGNDWTLTVTSVTPNADGQVIDNGTSQPAVPPAGAQFLMLDVQATYNGGGSYGLTTFSVNWFSEGSHNAQYRYYDDEGCGEGADVSLPAPDLTPMIQNNQQVYSGQSVTGNICFQVAANDASSLLFDVGYPSNAWFALS